MVGADCLLPSLQKVSLGEMRPGFLPFARLALALPWAERTEGRKSIGRWRRRRCRLGLLLQSLEALFAKPVSSSSPCRHQPSSVPSAIGVSLSGRVSWTTYTFGHVLTDNEDPVVCYLSLTNPPALIIVLTWR